MENRYIYLKSLLAYFIVFYILSSVLVLVLGPLFTNIYNVDDSSYNLVIQSGNFMSYINTEHHNTVIALVSLSSYVNLLTYIILATLLILYLKEDLKDDLEIFSRKTDSENKIKPFIKTVFIYFAIYYGLTLLSSFFISALNEWLSLGDSENQIFIEFSLEHAAIPMVIATALLGPLVEELIFRKTIFSLIKNKGIALCVSTLSFGCIHIISSISSGYSIVELIVLTLPYLTAGLIFGYIYIKTQFNFLYVTIIHMLSNIIALILIFTM